MSNIYTLNGNSLLRYDFFFLQIVTAALLIYSAFAAIYYAKFNLVTADYDYDYGSYGGGRTFGGTPNNLPWLGLSPQTFQVIIDAISRTKFS